jgi:hypothetical protein
MAVPLGELEIDAGLAAELRLAVARGLCEIAGAIARSFPNNLFADLEVLVGVLERGGAHHGGAWVGETAARIAELHDAFGCETTIRFRYVHDFLYGFDWARWVRSDPGARAGIGPFDEGFLRHAQRRAGELEALIACDDTKYPRIPRGVDRNPFPFHRDPPAEERLLGDLAARGWIPVEAWRRDPQPDWRRDFVSERERTAASLGLLRAR